MLSKAHCGSDPGRDHGFRTASIFSMQMRQFAVRFRTVEHRYKAGITLHRITKHTKLGINFRIKMSAQLNSGRAYRAFTKTQHNPTKS